MTDFFSDDDAPIGRGIKSARAWAETANGLLDEAWGAAKAWFQTDDARASISHTEFCERGAAVASDLAIPLSLSAGPDYDSDGNDAAVREILAATGYAGARIETD